MGCCPTCGRTIRKIDPATEERIEALRLPNKQRRIVEALMDAWPRRLRNAELAGHAYDDEAEDPKNPEGYVLSLLSHARRRLRGVGLDIRCERNAGYTLVVPEEARR